MSDSCRAILSGQASERGWYEGFAYLPLLPEAPVQTGVGVRGSEELPHHFCFLLRAETHRCQSGEERSSLTFEGEVGVGEVSHKLALGR